MRLSMAIVILLLAPGCRQANVEAGIFFPTWNSGGDAPTGIVQGVLVEEDQCLFVEANQGKTLVLWEDGMGYENGTLLDKAGTPIAHLGGTIHGGGGYFSNRTHIEGLAEETIPNRCVLDGPERFALIYEVAPGRSN